MATEKPTTETLTKSQTANSLRNLYFTRAAFSIVWITLVSIFANSSPSIAAVLLVIYPVWDVIGTFLDIRANRGAASFAPQYTNAAISIITAIAVAFALTKDVPSAIIVFGIWACLTGAIQLFLGLKRRKELGGQWPMIISGGQSFLAGISIIVLAHDPEHGIASLALYSAFGAFYYLLAAIRLTKSAKPAVSL